jgi:hypothetical protein
MPYLKSREVTALLKIPYSRLISILRSGKLPQPDKDVSGDLIWSPRDVANVRRALSTPKRREKIAQ